MLTHNGKNLLSESVRNHYFYGKLMDVEHFQLETYYHTQKRQLLNRLFIGSGVLCGLEVTAGRDGMVCISPGVAIDGHGRELIVFEKIPVDFRRITDDNGQPTRAAFNSRHVLISLAYVETKTDLVPALVHDCMTDDACECSHIREGVVVLVQSGQPYDPSFRCSTDLFEQGGQIGFSIRAALVQRSLHCPENSGPAKVPLALLTLPEQGGGLEINLNVRTPVVTPAMLLELLVCMAERVDECCGQPAMQLMLEQVDYICIHPQDPNQNADENPEEYISSTLMVPPYQHAMSIDNELLVAVRMTFNQAIEPDSIRTGISMSPFSTFSLQVSRVDADGQWQEDIAVEVTPDPIDPSRSFRIRVPESPSDSQVGDDRVTLPDLRVAPMRAWERGMVSESPVFFPSGYYQITLRGTGPAPIRAQESGLALDGDRDKTPGGNSIIKFRVDGPLN